MAARLINTGHVIVQLCPRAECMCTVRPEQLAELFKAADDCQLTRVALRCVAELAVRMHGCGDSALLLVPLLQQFDQRALVLALAALALMKTEESIVALDLTHKLEQGLARSAGFE